MHFLSIFPHVDRCILTFSSVFSIYGWCSRTSVVNKYRKHTNEHRKHMSLVGCWQFMTWKSFFYLYARKIRRTTNNMAWTLIHWIYEGKRNVLFFLLLYFQLQFIFLTFKTNYCAFFSLKMKNIATLIMIIFDYSLSISIFIKLMLEIESRIIMKIFHRKIIIRCNNV